MRYQTLSCALLTLIFLVCHAQVPIQYLGGNPNINAVANSSPFIPSPATRDTLCMGSSSTLNSLFIYGGYGRSVAGLFNDVWQFNLTSRTWTNLFGSLTAITAAANYGSAVSNQEGPTLTPGGRFGSSCFFDDTTLSFYVVSGGTGTGWMNISKFKWKK